MVFKKKSKKTFKRKAARPRRRHRVVFGDVPSSGSRLGLLSRSAKLDPFPQKWNRALTYGDNIVLALPALGVCSEHIFRLNSVFDPDFTAAGHQPLYRDQIAALYNAYFVRRTRVQITFTDPSQDGAFAYVGSGFTGVGGVTLSRLQEMPFFKVDYVNNTGRQRLVYDETLDLAKAAGLTKAQYKNDIASTGALIGSNPVLGLYLRVGGGNTNAAAGAGTIVMSIRLTFYCQFYDRVIPAQS